MAAIEKLSTVERLAIAGKVAPTMRRQERRARRITTVDAQGNPVRVIDTDALAKRLLARAQIEFSTEKAALVECIGCGVAFMPKRVGQKFHTIKCGQASWARAHKVKRKAADREYHRRYYADNRAKWTREKRTSTYATTRECPTCGETFSVKKSTQRFCSKACRLIAWEKENKERLRVARAEKARAWRTANPTRVAQIKQRHRAKKRAA